LSPEWNVEGGDDVHQGPSAGSNPVIDYHLIHALVMIALAVVAARIGRTGTGTQIHERLHGETHR
jgi:hypothetical protein